MAINASGSTDEFHAEMQRLTLTDAMLDRLRGKMTLIQPADERVALVQTVLASLYREHGHDRFPQLNTEEDQRAFLEAFLSYDLIEEFLADPLVEDIMINSTDAIFVHKTGYGLEKTDRRFATTFALQVFIKKLLIFSGRTELEFLNDIELADVRGRVNIVASPFGPQITITRGKPQPMTMFDLIDSGMLPYELAAQLWMYVEGLRVRPANLIIAGGPGTGKTTLLNALLSLIPGKERLVIIEDTVELNTLFLENCCRLESSRQADMAALVKNSLRMRPDRILVGEVRGEEAHDLMTAINLGKYCMSTVHASSARETLLRMQNEPMNVPPMLLNLVDVLVVLRKQNLGGKISRVVDEVVETSGMEQQVVLLSTTWTFDHVRHQIVESSPSSVYRDRLAALSGRTPIQIMEETARRVEFLKALHTRHRSAPIDSVTQHCQRYSDNPVAAMKAFGLNPTPDEKRKTS